MCAPPLAGSCRAVFWTILLLILPAHCSSAAEYFPVGKPYLVENWQTDEGLPQNSVTSMAQTKDGYLWLGTFNGLVRFDGVRFTVFNNRTTPEMPNSRIVFLWLDKSGTLWIGTESGGLLRLKHGKFDAFSLPESFQNGFVMFMCEDASGAVWFTTNNGHLGRFQDGQITADPVRWGLKGFYCKTVARDGDRLWLGSDHGLLVWQDGKFTAEPAAEPLKLPRFDMMTPSKTGGFWVAANQRVQKVREGKLSADFGPYPWSKGAITTIHEDRNGEVWVGTYGSGLLHYDKNGKLSRVTTSEGLSHDNIRSIFDDQEGNFWVGTDGGGLNRLKEPTFSVYDRAHGLSDDIVLSVCEDDDGALWIGTNGGGVNRLQNGIARQFGAEDGLGGDHVWSVFADKKKNVWAGTWGSGLFRLRGGQFEPAESENGVVLAAFEDRKGNLWFGTQGGLVRRGPNERRLFTVADRLSHNDVRAIAEDADGDLWIGTNGGGLNRFKDGQFTSYRKKDGLGEDSVWCLHADADRVLWIGTCGGGLSRLEAGKFSNFTAEDGLPDNVICHIEEDSRGNLWMSSYNGVFRVAKQDLKNYRRQAGQPLPCVGYGKADGLPSRECTGGFQPSGVKTRDGNLVFPTIKGVAMLNPEQIKTNPLPPPTVIEEVYVDGGKLVDIGQLRRLKIPYGCERFEIRYTALSFSAPDKVRFTYKMEGLDGDWVDAGSRRVAYYSHPPAGEFTFRVRACNNDGVWNKAGAVLKLSIPPPFWTTWWFVASSVLAVAGGIAGVARIAALKKMHRQMERLEQQHAVEKERSRIAKDIHDDLGASLTQITLLSELARSDLLKPAQAEGHIRNISLTARELTRSMDEIVWAVNPQNDTLEDLISYTSKYAQEFLGLAGIRCRLDVPHTLPGDPLSAETRHNLFLVVKEALHNVVKHSKASEVWFRISPGQDSFVLMVEDNGIGIDLQAENLSPSEGRIASGNGILNMSRRTSEVGGTLEIRCNSLGGASVCIHMGFKSKGGPPAASPRAV